MFNQAIRRQLIPKYLSSDRDPLYRFHQWQANLRVLGVIEVKTVPYVPRRFVCSRGAYPPFGLHVAVSPLADFRVVICTNQLHDSSDNCRVEFLCLAYYEFATHRIQPPWRGIVCRLSS